MGWWGGGPCDFSVSPSPFGLDFGTSDSGLTILCQNISSDILMSIPGYYHHRPSPGPDIGEVVLAHFTQTLDIEQL